MTTSPVGRDDVRHCFQVSGLFDNSTRSCRDLNAAMKISHLELVPERRVAFAERDSKVDDVRELMPPLGPVV